MSHPDKIPRLSRLTGILLKLQSRAMITIGELSEHFGVSSRTIYRDILALEQAGVPIVSMDGKGFSLVDGYHIPPVMFSQEEANALIIAEKIIARSTDASLIEAFGSAIEKIKSVLDPEEQEKSDYLSSRTIIGKNWYNERNSHYLSEIQQALTHHRVLQIEYLKKDSRQASTRKVEPFAIYNNTSEFWTLIAWCRLRKGFRTFRTDRIQKLHTLNEHFEPHQMSLEEYVEMQRKKYSPDTLT